VCAFGHAVKRREEKSERGEKGKYKILLYVYRINHRAFYITAKIQLPDDGPVVKSMSPVSEKMEDVVCIT